MQTESQYAFCNKKSSNICDIKSKKYIEYRTYFYSTSIYMPRASPAINHWYDGKGIFVVYL